MIILVMGVTGAGKTTIGSLLAQQLDWEFVDADNFHSPESVEKIRQGIALSDADRAPWLRAIRDAILKWIAERKNVVLACSALKREYRDELLVSPRYRCKSSLGSAMRFTGWALVCFLPDTSSFRYRAIWRSHGWDRGDGLRR